MSQNAILVCSVWFGVMSLATFVVYGVDKRRAKQEGDRISEKTLHVLSLLGGWPGAITGQKLFRHKTVKKSFRLVFWRLPALPDVVFVSNYWPTASVA